MKPGWIARQSRMPSGPIGRVVAHLMARETAAANAFVLARLRELPLRHVLEIGCGAGRNLEQLARLDEVELAVGVDPSDVMVALAKQRLRRSIERGRAEMWRGTAASLPFADGRFDAAFAVHVVYFWPNARDELHEIRRVLQPDGSLVLGFRPDDPDARAALPDSVYTLRSVSEWTSLVRGCGFAGDVQVAVTELAGAPFVCLRAGVAATRADGSRAGANSDHAPRFGGRGISRLTRRWRSA